MKNKKIDQNEIEIETKKLNLNLKIGERTSTNREKRIINNLNFNNLINTLTEQEFELNFDKYQIFQKYFIHNNVDSVIKQNEENNNQINNTSPNDKVPTFRFKSLKFFFKNIVKSTKSDISKK